MAEEKLELRGPDLLNYKLILEKIIKVEEKLSLLQDFNQKADKIRIARKKLLEHFMNMNEKNNLQERKETPSETLNEKRVTFNDTDKSTLLLPTYEAYKSKSLEELVKNLHSWSAEYLFKNGEIDQLKLKKEDCQEKGPENKRITQLEIEKDLLKDEILQSILKNMYGKKKEDYEYLILQLEGENNEMNRMLQQSEKEVDSLKQINIALMRENQSLKENKEFPFGALAVLDSKIRKSLLLGESFNMLSERYLSVILDCDRDSIPKSPSIQILLNLEKEDKLSLDKQSQDSFQLDKPLATWKSDGESLQEHVKRIGDNCHEMQIIHMKLIMVKRYVRKHGTKQINRNTLIDPCQTMSQWI